MHLTLRAPLRIGAKSFPALFDRLRFEERNYFPKGHSLFSLQMCLRTQMQDCSAQEFDSATLPEISLVRLVHTYKVVS